MGSFSLAAPKCRPSTLSFGSSIAAAPVDQPDNSTFKVTDTGDATGSVLEMYVYDAETAQWVKCEVPDTVRVIQPLVAGDNTITHNLGNPAVEVEVRNNATGAIISARVTAEAANSFTLFVPVAVADARITVDH